MSHQGNTTRHRRDDFVESQNRLNPKFKREVSLIKNYQSMLDGRLSVPKAKEEIQ